MVEIRPAAKEDIPQLASLFRQEAEHQQALAPHLKLNPRVDWEACAAASLGRANERVLVAEIAGRLVGFIDVRIIEQGDKPRGSLLRRLARKLLRPFRKELPPILLPRRFAFIDEIYLDPSLRRLGSGIAFKLLEQSVRWFEEQGVDEVEGLVFAGNKASLDFFQKAGGEPVRVLIWGRVATFRSHFPAE